MATSQRYLSFSAVLSNLKPNYNLNTNSPSMKCCFGKFHHVGIQNNAFLPIFFQITDQDGWTASTAIRVFIWELAVYHGIFQMVPEKIGS